MTTGHEWRMCACERAIPAHADTAPDPAGGTGCGMAWRTREAAPEIEDRHITDLAHSEVQPGGHLRQDVPAGLALPNHPAERTRRNRMVSPPERPGSGDDPRFTMGLIYDVFRVLEAHGYRRPDRESSLATADAVVALLRLVRAFEGTTGPEGGER
jgi:hypothetical protein